ncbi:MAG: aminotransferase class I/II-fold pyridoxal phosphate-dependent enzyme [Anaerovoracaceae bacterium]
MSRTTVEFLLDHARQKPISFHMPGHKGSAFYERLGYGEFLKAFVDCDITEIPGADNLFQTEGILKETQKRYARLYNVDKSYLLINGTSGGIIASILASVNKGGKLIMARNCHKSVFNALTLGDITPVYMHPQMNQEYGILGEITVAEVKKQIENAPESGAIILPSPNYYGICSDIKAIAKVAHDHGKVLIVDQAHGAHMKWLGKAVGENYPLCAEESEADIVINSTHKTLGSLTQSAVLNYNSRLVPVHLLEDKLQTIQSTSPSYVLMASLDINAEILEVNGKELMDQWADHLKVTYEELSKIEGLDVIQGLKMFDESKINVDTTRLGITANDLEAFLIEKNIFAELTTGNILMFMTGIGNTKGDYDRLIEELGKAAAYFSRKKQGMDKGTARMTDATKPPMPKEPGLEAVPEKKVFVPLEKSVGRICGSMIIPYPPGIPILCPGEKIEKDMVEYIRYLRKLGEKVIGVDEDGKILVGE